MPLSLAAYQDYLWFLAAGGWGVAAALAYWGRVAGRSRLAGEWRWLLALALAGVALSVAEMWLHVAERPFFNQPRWGDDALVAVPLAAMLLAAAWGGTVAGGRRRWFGWLAAVVAACGLRYGFPLLGSILLCAVAAGIGWAVARRREAGADAARLWVWWQWVPLVLLPAVSTTGPIAEVAATARRWSRLSTMGPPAALTLTVAAAAVLFLLLAALRETTFGRGETTPRARWRLAPLLALWLAGGLAFANWCGRQSRSTYEAAILAQARVGAATINASEVEECLDPAFKLESIVRIPTPDGREEIAATASHLRRSPAADLRRHLGLLRSATKDALWAQLLTLREGHLVAYAFDTRIPVATGLVSLLRQTSPADEAAWAGRLDFVEGPIYQSDQVVRVSAPIVTADRRMLGWFSLVFSVARWTNVQAYARLQAFALVAAGAALGLFALFARWRNLERTQAIAEADAAREADKIKTVFLAKVSHELRTPVQSILGYCELSLRGVTDAATRRHMQAVLSQGHVLVRLINDLIDLSAIQAGAFRLERRAFDVLALAREVTGSQSPAALMKGLGLSFIPEGAVPALLVGDPDRVRQIFVNLVGNALKYTARGSVTVILRAGPLVADSCACALAVEDTGPGIAAEDQARLFRPFGRLEPTAHIEGTGLGLALTKALCEAMDGSISVASEPGRGSTFTARFMLGAAPSLPSGEPAAPPVAPALRVLLADDNALVRELFHAWLTDAGAAVTTAADGVEVCERVAEAVPDVLVIDIAMPRLNGVEATRRLRAAGHLPPRLRIVGVSAHATAADRETALQAGMDAFLIKPVERHDLLAALVPPGRKGALSQEAALLEKLARIFARETPAQLESLAAAVAAGDFAAVARLAHLLRNSADVLQDGAFAAACARLETRAAAAQPMAGALAAVVAAAGRHLPSLSPLSTPAGGQLNPN